MMSMPKQFTGHGAAKEWRRHGHLAAISKGASGQWQAPGDIGQASSTGGISDSSLYRGDRFDEQFYKTQLCTSWRQTPGDSGQAGSTGGIWDTRLYRGDRFDEQFYKTQMCTFWQQGCCSRRVCRFAHGDAELRIAPNLTKTAMCRVVLQGGTCQDPTCDYAHHLREVRATGSYYKTVMCNFARDGSCRLGHQCRYAHSPDELRPRMEPDGLRSRTDPGSVQDLSEVGSAHGFDQPDRQGVRSTAAAELLAQIGWEDAPGSEHEFVQQPSLARPDAHLIAQGQASHPQEKPYPVEVPHNLATGSFRLGEQYKAAQERTCNSSPQADVQPNPFLRPVLMGGETAEACEGQHGREAIQVCAQYKEEYAQNHGLQQPTYQMQQPAQGWTCKSSPQADVQPNPFLRPLSMAVKSAEACEDQYGREAIQFSGQYEEEYAQNHSLQQPTYQMQQPAYQLPHVVRSHAGMPGNHARQQGVHIGTVPAHLPPGSNRDVPSMRLPGQGENACGNTAFASAWRASPTVGLAGSAARPGVDALGARERAQFSVDVPVPGSRLTPPMEVTPQQPPSWEPTLPTAAPEPSSPMAMQWLHIAEPRPMNPADAILREMQARVLKAAMPDHYED